MAEQILKSSRITGLNWDITKNLISIKSFKTIHLRKDNSEMKIEFLDENRRRCLLSLSNFKRLCDLRNAIEQMTSLIQDGEKTSPSRREHGKVDEQQHEASSHSKLLMESVLKFEYAKALIAGVPSVQRFNCTGCQCKSQDHQCLLLSIEEKLQHWFPDLLAFIDEAHVIQEISAICSAFDFIDKTMLEDFSSKLWDDDWRMAMKTEKWKAALLETAIRLTRLESRFQ